MAVFSTVRPFFKGLYSIMLNNSIGAPTPKNVPSETTTSKTPEWVHCEICKRREQNGWNNTRLPLGYCHPCGHIICRDCVMNNKNTQNCKYILNSSVFI